ncbi:unnamed protein product, partial [Sphacelaria rigidula]
TNSEKEALEADVAVLKEERAKLEATNREIHRKSTQLKEDLTREAKRLSRSERQNRLDLEKAFRDLGRQQEACKEQERGLEKLKRELE